MEHLLDLYIQNSENEQGSFEMTLAAEVVERERNRMYGGAQTAIEATEKVADKVAEYISSTDATPVVPELVAPTPGCQSVAVISRTNSATNWWLALIAFLLFMILCNIGE